MKDLARQLGMSVSTVSLACRRVGTPVIFFNRHAADEHSFSVTCDNVAGGEAVADFLLAKGLRGLGFVGGRSDASTNVDRWRGFSRRCEALGLPAPVRSGGNSFSYKDGYQAHDGFRGDGGVQRGAGDFKA